MSNDEYIWRKMWSRNKKNVADCLYYPYADAVISTYYGTRIFLLATLIFIYLHHSLRKMFHAAEQSVLELQVLTLLSRIPLN